MATLNKKLKVKSGSSTQSCNLYTTTTEAGTDNLKLKIDNTNVYASLTTTSNSQASKGRIKKNGTTKAIAISGKPPYTEKSWTKAGTYTFTVPAGVTRIRVAVCGGGGGGATSPRKVGSTNVGETGGISKFGNLIQATGGNGGKVYCRGSYTYKSGQTSYNKNNCYNGSGGSPNGKAGSTIGFNLNFNNQSGNYGKGGRGFGTYGNSEVNAIGGSGGYNSQYINVNPLETYNIIVGSGGKGKDGDNGSSGFVLIAYGGEI